MSHSDAGHSTVDELRAALNREKQEVTRLRARVEELEQTDVVALRALAAQVIEAAQPGLHEEDLLAFLYVIADDARRLLAKTFTPSARQLELMEHAVGGDSRHRNHFTSGAGSRDEVDWQALVMAGLASGWREVGSLTWNFRVSPAGLALLDARARPRILEAKARAWDALRAQWMEAEKLLVEPHLIFEAARNFINNDGPAPKGPRAIAEEIVNGIGDEEFERGKMAVGSQRTELVESIAEIIRKGLGGAS